MSTHVPPAASMRSRAVALNAWACTVSDLLSSPLASTLTGTPFFLAIPAFAKSSGLTSAPASKRA